MLFSDIPKSFKLFISSIRSRNKMAALGYAYTLGKQTSRSPERCTAQNPTGARFLEVQITP